MKPTHIIVHCSASEWGTVLDVDAWHKARGWKGIGYHAVILNGYVTPEDWRLERRDGLYDGALCPGRALDLDAELEVQEVGTHAAGWNNRTVAVCLIGKGTYTGAQMNVLRILVRAWMLRYSILPEFVLGHGEIPGVTKQCPMLDMDAFRTSIRNWKV
ncbi:MAG: N-acetylmuramoyl-L-alanine amidase [Tepidisphaeraceae bacterium]